MKRVMDLARIRKTVLLLALAAIATLLASGVGLLGVAGPVGAEPPKNGKILYTNVPRSGVSGERELQTMDPDGSNRASFTPPITGANTPAWSPDGTKFAFRNSALGLAVVGADGTGRFDLPNTSNALSPTWSPDGAKLAFEQRIFSEDQTTSIGRIFTINVDGTEKTDLSSEVPPQLSLQDPDWSPDGAKIALTVTGPDVPSEIYTMNADGTGQPASLANPAYGSAPAWSPDGSKIAFTGSDREIYVMNADGTEQTNVTNSGSLQESVGGWSPDGTKLVFSGEVRYCLTVCSIQRDIFTIGIDGSKRTNLTNTTNLNEVTPSWAPVPPDTAKPTTAATSSPQPNDNGWNDGEVKVTLSATDNDGGSGVDKITYSASGAQTIAQTDASGGSVEVTLDQEGTTTLTYYATDKAGNVEVQKTLEVKIDKTAPQVSSTSPANNATGVSATAKISATFLEGGSGIDPDTLTTDTFKVERVKPTGNVPVSGTLGYDEPTQTVTFTPDGKGLAKGLYRATITTGVEDKADNALANDYTWQFATAGPPPR
jgi:dipeptidyl aminopeptidase/acylaminoacyl peptidase